MASRVALALAVVVALRYGPLIRNALSLSDAGYAFYMGVCDDDSEVK